MLACWAFAEWLHWQQVGMPTRSISLCTFRLHSPQRLGQHTALISDTSDAVMSEIFGGRGVVALLRMPPVLSGLVVALLRMPPVLSGRRRTPPHATCVVWSSSHSPKKDATRTNHQVLQFPPFFFDIMFSFLVFFLVRPLLLSLPFEVGTTSYCIARVQTSQTSNQDSCSPLCPTPLLRSMTPSSPSPHRVVNDE